MLYLDDRAAEVYADMHADLEAARVGHRVPVQRPAESGQGSRLLRMKDRLHRLAVGLRYRVIEWYARAVHPQEQCC